MEAIDLRMDFRDVKIRVLGPLAAFNNNRRAHEPQPTVMGCEITFNLPRQSGLRMGQRLVKDDQNFRREARGVFIQNVFQHHVCPVENVLSEKNPQAIAHLNGALDRRHRLKDAIQTALFQSLFGKADTLAPLQYGTGEQISFPRATFAQAQRRCDRVRAARRAASERLRAVRRRAAERA
jgi:hypothetical protein